MATKIENKVKEYGKYLETYQKFQISDKISFTNSTDKSTANAILAGRQVRTAIAGGTSVDDVVLCANYGVSSTGLTLRLNWGVFCESFKSIIINIQSIGRGLCLDNTNNK